MITTMVNNMRYKTIDMVYLGNDWGLSSHRDIIDKWHCFADHKIMFECVKKYFIFSYIYHYIQFRYQITRISIGYLYIFRWLVHKTSTCTIFECNWMHLLKWTSIYSSKESTSPIWMNGYVPLCSMT